MTDEIFAFKIKELRISLDIETVKFTFFEKLIIIQEVLKIVLIFNRMIMEFFFLRSIHR